MRKRIMSVWRRRWASDTRAAQHRNPMRFRKNPQEELPFAIRGKAHYLLSAATGSVASNLV